MPRCPMARLRCSGSTIRGCLRCLYAGSHPRSACGDVRGSRSNAFVLETETGDDIVSFRGRSARHDGRGVTDRAMVAVSERAGRGLAPNADWLERPSSVSVGTKRRRRMTEDDAFRYEEKYYAPLSAEDPADGAKPLSIIISPRWNRQATWPRNEFGRPDPEHRPNYRALRSQALDIPRRRGRLQTGQGYPGDAMPDDCRGRGCRTGPDLARVLDLITANAVAYWPRTPSPDGG